MGWAGSYALDTPWFPARSELGQREGSFRAAVLTGILSLCPPTLS